MKKSFREYHLFKALDGYDFNSLPLDVHLRNYFQQNRALGSKDRQFLAETIYAIVRWKGLIDYHCEEKCDWNERYRVHQNLNLKKNISDESIPVHIRASIPKDFFNSLAQHYGEKKALALCLASNTPAPITVRVNVLKTTRQNLLSQWKDQYGVVPTSQSVFGISFPKRLNFQLLKEFKKGFFEVQDEASQLIAGLIDAKPGNHVLDYCAGAGGKTLAFAHKLQGQGQIYLHDIRPKALLEAKRRLRRAGIENGQILPEDAPHKKQLKEKMDWVLVDVPCSGSGTLRRNPDLKWKFSKETLERLIDTQKEIFKTALDFLKPGGKIVYATCSILPQENEEQILYFQDHFNLELVTKPFRSYPTEGGMDGFFAASLKKPALST